IERYCAFMAERNLQISSVSDDDNDAWMAMFKEQSYSQRVRAAAVPRRLFIYRPWLPFAVSTVMPWKDRQPCEVLG
ncbi:hypothetical protein, partial [Klebsiella pneumoniae]